MANQELKPIAILGAGSWGTALALSLARRHQIVQIWSIEESEIIAMKRDKANERYLPGHPLPETIHPTTELKEALNGVEDVLVVVPSVGFKQTMIAIKPLIQPSTRIVCATKGLDMDSGQLLKDVVYEVLGQDRQFAVLSGPSFAKEVAAGIPTAVVIAGENPQFVAELAERFNSNIFHIDTSDDVIGVEIGGVVKNVIAIATGVSDGLKYGVNTRSAIITRGLAEITRFGVALGAKPETFVGLSGMGDLILTCSDNQSRNRRLGLAIGEGKDIEAAEREIGQAVEGKRNAELVITLAQKYGVHMPVCDTVFQLLQSKLTAKAAIEKLMIG